MTEPPLSGLNLHLDGIGHLLRDRLLSVPAYQRSYSWVQEQVEAFWNDLRGAMLNDVPDYFLGTVVLTPDAGRLAVIDGQQRLATVSILLATFRDVLREADEVDRSLVIEQTYLANRDLRSGDKIPRLALNSEDSTYFLTYVVGAAPTPTEFDFPSNRRLAAAKEWLRRAVDADLNMAGGKWSDRLYDWVDFLERRLKVITIDVASEADAFLIFETLNDRGLDLTVADLLKNYLLSLGQARSGDSVERQWLDVVSAFDADAGGDDTTTSFIRHYWSSLHGPVRERELYQSLKRRVRSRGQATAFVESLAASAASYAALLNADHERWQELSVPQDLVDTLLRLGLEQPRPLLLAAMDTLQPPDLEVLLRAVVSWEVRGLVVGGIGGGTTERYYARAAQAVRKGTVGAPAEVGQLLEPIIESDRVFEENFALKRVTQERLARYYLAALERASQGESHPELVGRDFDAARLALVVPRRALETHWPRFSTDQLGAVALRLGNQVLLDWERAKIRGSWDAIRDELARSSYMTTRGAAEVVEWSLAAVEERQREMAQQAVRVWPRDR